MNQPRPADIARQFTGVFAANFQVYASYGVGDAAEGIAQENHSLIFPAMYAFAIWGPNFLLCGLDQALPAQRENPIFRAIGWWTAAAFVANGIWSYAYVNRQFVLAQLIIFGGFVFAGAAYLRFARTAAVARSSTMRTWSSDQR